MAGQTRLHVPNIFEEEYYSGISNELTKLVPPWI